MMVSLRKVLVKIIGFKNYLRLISSVYLRLMQLGLFKQKYAELHFIKTILKPGNTAIDIGANLGYYSFFMSRTIGSSGQLIAIEPIPLFAEIWKKNVRGVKGQLANLHNCALGMQKQDSVTMSIPIVNGVIRHGLTNINANVGETALSFDVPMENGDDLVLKQQPNQIDFIKCDVEGYEQFVIPSLNATIDQFKPVIQIELNGESNRENVMNFLVKKGYDIYILDFNKLKHISKEEIHTFNQDFYFIHPEHKTKISHLIN